MENSSDGPGRDGRNPDRTGIIAVVAILTVFALGFLNAISRNGDEVPAQADTATDTVPTTSPVPTDVQYIHQGTNVRAGRSTDTEVVTTLARGDRVRTDGTTSDGWARVYPYGLAAMQHGADSALGYVYADLLADSPPPAREPSMRQELEPQELSVPPDLKYEIISEDTYQNERRSLDVRLSQKVGEDGLKELAQRFREQASGSYERTFIVYYLPGMEVDAGGWATSHFDPDLDVQILGVSEEASSQIENIRDQYGQNLIGIWENNQPGSAATFALFRTESGFALEEIFPDGSSRTLTVQEQPSEIGRRFQDPENTFGEYWLLRGGRLELHDPEGVISVAQPISGEGS